jgi:ubiquinone/menaquinone biosynthesis C-methylase UbiE
MNNSLSFDRAAGYYDQTRPLLEPIARQGVRAILEQTGSAARILDVGTGTGRISIPLLEQGADVVGCDLSSEMMRRLQEKFPSARIAQADASRLPFPAAHFDAVLTVHVIHLIAPWQEALREFKRVLKPGGVYLNVRTYASVGVTTRERMRKFWRDWVEAQGVQIYQPGVRDYQEFLNELKSLGAELSEVEVVRFTLPFTLREELERFTARVYSDAWHIPDDVHQASLEELRSWVAREYNDLDQPREDEVRFMIDAARFGEALA